MITIFVCLSIFLLVHETIGLIGPVTPQALRSLLLGGIHAQIYYHTQVLDQPIINYPVVEIMCFSPPDLIEIK